MFRSETVHPIPARGARTILDRLPVNGDPKIEIEEDEVWESSRDIPPREATTALLSLIILRRPCPTLTLPNTLLGDARR